MAFEVRFNGLYEGKFNYNIKVIVKMKLYSTREAHIQLQEKGYKVISRIFEYNKL